MSSMLLSFYDDEPILPFNLYVVKDFTHPLTTQNRCLVYGKYMQGGMQILAFKPPSFIKKVDYAKLVSELYDTKVFGRPGSRRVR